MSEPLGAVASNGACRAMGWTVREWCQAYRTAAFEPSILLELRASLDAGDAAWIRLATRQQLQEQLDALERRKRRAGDELARLPLYGVPFAVKDNIDVAGWETTAACPLFAYRAQRDATVVAELRAAGAIVMGKTNLDQFATGLAGDRTPYGPVPSPFDARYVAGGSSSGSASVVARGLVAFSLGTDTAGSGRVPAAFNNLVGLKPSRGRFSTRGVVPACRTLDCVSLFTLDVRDASLVASALDRFDPDDPYSRSQPRRTSELRRRLAVPRQLEFFGDEQAERAFGQVLERLRGLGFELVELDYTPFRQLAALLYEGPWVAERATVVRPLLEREPSAVHPVVRELVRRAERFSAQDAFAAEYRRAELARQIQLALEGFDALVVPTAPRCYRLDEVEAEPIETVSRLGYYTNFANLADLCGLALPGPLRADGLPAGLTLLARAGQDASLIQLGALWEANLGGRLGALSRSRELDQAHRSQVSPSATDVMVLAVVGAHLRGMPLNSQLLERGARFVEVTQTSPNYRLYALRGTEPAKPGLARVAQGALVEVELWELPVRELGSFTLLVPPPLGIGTLELRDGRWVKGFICEPHALTDALDISHFGGWRAYLRAASQCQ